MKAKQSEGDDAKVLKAAQRPIKGFGVVELEEQEGNGKEEEEAMGELRLIPKGVEPKYDEDEQGKKIPDRNKEREIEVLNGDELKGDEGVQEDQLVLIRLRGCKVENFLGRRRQLLKVLGEFEDGGIVI